jgi:hypothetical protein
VLLVTIPLPTTIVSGLEEQQWLTYEDPDFGYSIQYPSDWQDLGGAINYENTSSKSIRLPERYPLGAFMVEIAPVERYLDPDSLTLKTKTFQDYVRGHIADISSDPRYEVNKNISTTIGQNHYPAVQTHFIEGANPENPFSLSEKYWVDTIMLNDEHVYLLRFFAPSLDIPELLLR